MPKESHCDCRKPNVVHSVLLGHDLRFRVACILASCLV